MIFSLFLCHSLSFSLFLFLSHSFFFSLSRPAVDYDIKPLPNMTSSDVSTPTSGPLCDTQTYPIGMRLLFTYRTTSSYNKIQPLKFCLCSVELMQPSLVSVHCRHDFIFVLWHKIHANRLCLHKWQDRQLTKISPPKEYKGHKFIIGYACNLYIYKIKSIDTSCRWNSLPSVQTNCQYVLTSHKRKPKKLVQSPQPPEWHKWSSSITLSEIKMWIDQSIYRGR